MTMTMTNLPRDLVKEILSRVAVKSIRAVRSTCKNWNVLFKDERFANKCIEKASARDEEYLMITGASRDSFSNVYLYETHNKNFGLSINPKDLSIAREHPNQTLDQVFVSNGLLLCVWRNPRSTRGRLLVWNPYWGKRRWIECTTYCFSESFAFGYDKSCGSHKILRLRSDNARRHMDIYDVSSDLWRTLDSTFDRHLLDSIELGLSLKGNTYFESDGFLYCFDFTRECFGPRLPLPLPPSSQYAICLSSVKEEKLAALFSPCRTFGVDIWVTNKIEEPYAVSWSKFFKVETETIQHIDKGFRSGHFFIDEEKKVTVVFDMYGGNNKSYIFSVESGHVKEVDLIQYSRAFEFVGCYVPSSVQI